MVYSPLDALTIAQKDPDKRVVDDNGNASALNPIAEVFELREFFEWRGLDSINHSDVKINDKYSQYDAEIEFKLKEVTVTDPEYVFLVLSIRALKCSLPIIISAFRYLCMDVVSIQNGKWLTY